GVLRGVGSILGIAEDAETEVVHALAVPFDEPLEGVWVSEQRATDQLLIALGRVHERTLQRGWTRGFLLNDLREIPRERQPAGDDRVRRLPERDRDVTRRGVHLAPSLRHGGVGVGLPDGDLRGVACGGDVSTVLIGRDRRRR